MLEPVRVAAPAAMPLTLEDAKAHLRVTHSDEDGLIADLIEAATDMLDGWHGSLRRCLITQDWAFSYSKWPESGAYVLPFLPASALVSVEALSGGQTVALLPAEARLSQRMTQAVVVVCGSMLPTLDDDEAAVTVTARFGYGATAAAVPARIRQALKVMVADAYEHRESTVVGAAANAVKTSMHVDRLLLDYARPQL